MTPLHLLVTALVGLLGLPLFVRGLESEATGKPRVDEGARSGWWAGNFLREGFEECICLVKPWVRFSLDPFLPPLAVKSFSTLPLQLGLPHLVNKVNCTL